MDSSIAIILFYLAIAAFRVLSNRSASRKQNQPAGQIPAQTDSRPPTLSPEAPQHKGQPLFPDSGLPEKSPVRRNPRRKRQPQQRQKSEPEKQPVPWTQTEPPPELAFQQHKPVQAEIELFPALTENISLFSNQDKQSWGVNPFEEEEGSRNKALILNAPVRMRTGKADLIRGVIWSEVLGQPRSKRPMFGGARGVRRL